MNFKIGNLIGKFKIFFELKIGIDSKTDRPVDFRAHGQDLDVEALGQHAGVGAEVLVGLGVGRVAVGPRLHGKGLGAPGEVAGRIQLKMV